jgi:hypothetical protein
VTCYLLLQGATVGDVVTALERVGDAHERRDTLVRYVSCHNKHISCVYLLTCGVRLCSARGVRLWMRGSAACCLASSISALSSEFVARGVVL